MGNKSTSAWDGVRGWSLAAGGLAGGRRGKRLVRLRRECCAQALESRLLLSSLAGDPTGDSAVPSTYVEGEPSGQDVACRAESPTRAAAPAIPSPPVGSRPFGATSTDTSEYMIGSVYVTVVLFESDGKFDPSSENWTPAQIANVKSQVTEALNWWQQVYANAGYTSSLNFTTDFTYTDSPFETKYEPITRPSDGFWLSINDFLNAAGYNPSFDGVTAFDDAQRLAHNTDWAYTVFIANSANDADGQFANGSSAFAYVGGPCAIMTYDNGGWGINNMGQVLAHETGHIFYALDEYPGGDLYTERSGYYNTQNLNASDGNPNPFTRVDSLMAESPGQDNAYASYTSSPTSLQMLGWKDVNINHIINILDQPLTLASPLGTVDLSQNQYVFSATSSVTTMPNQNPRGNGDSITLNEVDYLQYRIDGGAWTNYNTTSYHTFTQSFSNVRVNVPPTWSSIDFRTISAESGATSALFSDTNWRPAVNLSINPGDGKISETGGAATVTATLSKTCVSDVVVGLAFSGTATWPADYSRSAISIVVPAGSTTASITLTAVNNSIQNPNKTIVIDIATVSNGMENGTQQVTSTILDNDPTPTVQFTASSQSAMENAGTITVAAQLSAASGYDVSVPFSVSGSAVSGADYTIGASPLVIAAGSTSANIVISLINNAIDQLNRTVVVTMGTPTRATASGITACTTTILDDEVPALAAIGNQTIDELSALGFTASAVDPAAPAHSLAFSLDAGAPPAR